ncbi:MAG: asparagine synthase-related protein [Bacteroidetes bacterium]|nr:asparagine synthase-related protein [Bacteroidota bacterium]
MSTIFGIIDKSGQGFDRQWLELMGADLAHGNPDHSGLWQNGNAGIGNLQVFNTPESLKEILPHEDFESGVAICSDSRIDNRSQLAGLLRINEGELRTMSDSSLILKAWQKWETGCCAYLRGDFSFGIYDIRSYRFFLARDHFGMRPLFYYDHPRFFIFSTELRGILALPFFNREVNNVWLLDFLINVDREARDTFYKGILSLPPGHSITIGNGNVSLDKYWELALPEKQEKKTDREYIEGYKTLFAKAVKDRTRSAYPVGAELSGGLDSSSVVSFAQEQMPADHEQLHVFARVLPDRKLPDQEKDNDDETSGINLVCNFCGIGNPHLITMEGEKISDNISSVVDVLRSPYASNYAAYNLAIHHKARSAGIRTMLSGHGGDQMVTSPAAFVYHDYYKKHRYLTLLNEIQARGTPQELPILQSIKHLLNMRPAGNGSGKKRSELKKMLKYGLNPELVRQYNLEHNYLKQRETAILMTSNLQELILKITNRHMNDRIETTALTAGHDSIEYRYPMYDVDLIGYYLSVPDELRRRFRVGRYLHRIAMQGHLPEPIIWRQDKHVTINPGLSLLFSNDSIRIKEVLSEIIRDGESCFSRIFNPEAVNHLLLDKDPNMLNYKSLINKYFQLYRFKNIVENIFAI